MKNLLMIILMLTVFALTIYPSSTALSLDNQDNIITITVPSNESFTLSMDFKILNYSIFKSSLDISLGNESLIKLYLNEHVTSLLPGFYLLNNSEVTNKKVMLEASKWYSLIFNYNHTMKRLTIYLKALNSSYIALDIRLVMTLFNQGLTFNGNNWFFTETTTICKLSKDLSKIIKCNFDPIPEFLKKEEYFHFGDLDYYNNVLVIPVEKTKYVRPAIIAIYDSNTLKLMNYSYTPQDHMPWIALDNNGYIYTSEYSPVTEIYVYHINQIRFGNYIKPVKVIKLKDSLRNIQGGVVVSGGLLALTSDDGDHVYFVNISTGEIVDKIRLPGLYEMEGIEKVKERYGEYFYILFNTQGLGKNVLYKYQYMSSGEELELFSIKCRPFTVVKVAYDNKTIQLGSTKVITPSLERESTPPKNYTPIITLIIAVTLIITLIFARRRR